MQDYALAPNGNISMADTEALRVALEGIAEAVEAVVETGTYRGLGSTKLLAEVFKTQPIETVEANLENFRIAEKNLRANQNVRCRYGSSVWVVEAEAFMGDDWSLQNHQHIPEIYIDRIAGGEELARWYLAEVRGGGGEQNLLVEMLAKFADRKKLVLLDSAGGIGWLEFQVAVRELIGQEFYLLLDDTHHLKHYRSVQYALGLPEQFEVVGSGEAGDWYLFKCRPTQMVR